MKVKSLGWILIQINWCPHKKGKFGHKHNQKEDNVKTQGEESQGKKSGTHPSLTALEGTTLPAPSSHNCETSSFFGLSHLVFS